MKGYEVSQKLGQGKVIKLEIQVNIRPWGILSSILGNYD